MGLQGTIAFASGRSGDFDIWRLDLPTQDLIQLTSGSSSNDYPRWSPDGTQIAFTSDRSGAPEIWLMDEWGDDQRPLTNKRRAYTYPAWSPDGATIVCCANHDGSEELELWEISVKTGEAQKIFSGPGQETEPCFSPDGRFILFASRRSGSYDLWELERASGALRQITTGGSKDFCGAYSPDGVWIAYLVRRDIEDDSEVWLCRRDGASPPIQLTDNRVHENYLTWSPDGRYIMYCSTRSAGEGRIRVLDVASSQSRGLSYDRSALEREIGAAIVDTGVFSMLTPDWLQRKFVNPVYFGSERNPHWRAS